jgi:methylthioribose-1-phosphate isomerase
MWSFTDPVWEVVFKWATIAALIFGGIGIVSAFVSAWIGYEITDATQRDAIDKLKRADERIAEARERTAALEVEAARLRLELDREIQKRAQRLLTEEQRTAIREGLKGMKEIALVVQHDLEAEAFALQIMTSFPEGLRIYGPKPPPADNTNPHNE